MTLDTIRVLHVDDDTAFLNLVNTYLKRVDEFSVVSISDPEEAVQKFEYGDIDCIVSDYEMPQMDGISLLKTIRNRDVDFPFILYTGKGSETIAGEAISAGVSDYVQKSSGRNHYEVLANRIRSHVARYVSEKRIQQVYEAVDAVDEGFAILDEDESFLHVNQAYAAMFGYDRSELVGENWEILYKDEETEEVKSNVISQAVSTGSWTGQTREVQKDGTEIVVNHKLLFTSEGLMVCTVNNPIHADGTEPVARIEV